MTNINAKVRLISGRLITVAMCTVFLLMGPVFAQDRLALIIGNSTYESVRTLKNSKNDATAVGETLSELGFDVTILTNATSEEFWLSLDDFVNMAETAETTLFYYSGHAFQLEGANYLVPVNAQLKSRQSIVDETWSLDGIIKRLQARNRQTLVFLDACRNSPLPQYMTLNGGLARVNTGTGTFIAFATEPGAVACNGQGDNNPFTTALLNHLETPSISISDMMVRVRNEVEERTLRRQKPWDQSNLRSQFYFQPEYENAPTLTASDYELLAQLDPNGRERFLALLAESGIAVDGPAELIEGESLELAVADENSVIFAAPIPASLPNDFPASSAEVNKAIRAEDVAIIDDVSLIFSVPDVVRTTQTAKATSGVAQNVGPVVIELASLEQMPSNTLNHQTIDTFLPGSAPAATANGSIDTQNLEASSPTESAAIAADSGALTATANSGRPAALVRAGTAIAARAQGEIIRVTALTSATRSLPVLAFKAPTIKGREVLPDSDERRAILAGIDPTLLEELSTPNSFGINQPLLPEFDAEEMASDVQTELSRLGCYRMRIDGDWGNGSRRALTSYFLNKRIVPESLEPSLPLLRQLKSEGEVICQVRVARAKPSVKRVATKKSATKVTSKKKTPRKIVRPSSAAQGTTKKRITKLSTGVFR